MLFGNRLQPYGLPDARHLSVPDTACSTRVETLLTYGLGGLIGIVDNHHCKCIGTWLQP